MAIILILTFTMLSMWAAVVFCYRMGAIENGKYLLGITLPEKYRKEPEVLAVIKAYQKRMRRINGFGLAACVPVLLLNGYMSFAFLGIMIWFGLLMYFHLKNIRDSAQSLYVLKQRKGWLVGNPHVVRIDTALSSLKDTGMVPFRWLAAAWLAGLGGCMLLIGRETAQAGPTGGAISIYGWVAMLCFVLAELSIGLAHYGIGRAKHQVYCSDSRVNQKLDRVMRHEWSRCMVFQAYILAVLMLVTGWMWSGGPGIKQGDHAGSRWFFLFAVFLGAAVSLFTICAAYSKVSETRKRLLGSLPEDSAELYGDDDEYWLYGYPAGKRPAGLTERRIGAGWSSSSSAALGLTEKSALVVIALLSLGISLFLMPFDFADISMEIEGNRCRISGASMGYSFDLDEIQEIALMHERPSMSKRSGYDSNRFYLGDFRVEGYGTCKAYVFVKNDSVIKVVTPEKIIWFNGKNEEETRLFYEELKDARKKISCNSAAGMLK